MSVTGSVVQVSSAELQKAPSSNLYNATRPITGLSRNTK